jgi:hypothetical protein
MHSAESSFLIVRDLVLLVLSFCMIPPIALFWSYFLISPLRRRHIFTCRLNDYGGTIIREMDSLDEHGNNDVNGGLNTLTIYDERTRSQVRIGHVAGLADFGLGQDTI